MYESKFNILFLTGSVNLARKRAKSGMCWVLTWGERGEEIFKIKSAAKGRRSHHLHSPFVAVLFWVVIAHT